MTRFSNPLASTLLSLLVFSVVLLAHVQATPTPSRTCCTTCNPGANSNSNNKDPLFGVATVHHRRIPLIDVRGGAVLEPESLSDVESILVKAGSEQKLVVIDFSAAWCGPCKQIAPLFKELSESFGEVVFLKIDVDDNPETAAKYNVSAMPTFLFIKAGEIVDRLMGANAAKLQELISEHQ